MKKITTYIFVIALLGLAINVSGQGQGYENGSVITAEKQKEDGLVKFASSRSIHFKKEEEKNSAKYSTNEIIAIKIGEDIWNAKSFFGDIVYLNIIELGTVKLYKEGARLFIMNENLETLELKRSNSYKLLRPYVNAINWQGDVSPETANKIVSSYNRLHKRQDNNAVEGFITVEETNATTFNSFSPNGVRNLMLVSPEQLYPEMFSALQSNNWTKVERALDILKPLISEAENDLNQKIASNLNRAVRKKETQKVKEYLLLLATSGIEDLVQSANSVEDANSKKILLKQAFVEFLKVKSYYPTEETKLCGNIEQQLRQTFAVVNNDKMYSAGINKVQTSLKELRASI